MRTLDISVPIPSRRVLSAGAAALGLAAIAVLGGCTDRINNRRGLGDAPIGKRYESKVDIIVMPDRFSNVATRCNPVQAGTRIYVVTHAKSDPPPVVIADPACTADPGKPR